jgi:hypothetical protein
MMLCRDKKQVSPFRFAPVGMTHFRNEPFSYGP